MAGHKLVNKAGKKDKSPICNKYSKHTQQTWNGSVSVQFLQPESIPYKSGLSNMTNVAMRSFAPSRVLCWAPGIEL